MVWLHQTSTMLFRTNRLCRGGGSSSRQLLSSARLVLGKADSAMTQRFVAASKLPLYHKFERSQLYINPIIHGPPAFKEIEDHEYIDLLAKRAVLQNRSNCLVVYEHLTVKPYFFKGMRSLLEVEPSLSRQQLVTMANLGSPCSSAELARRLSEACQLSQLEHIDFAYFEVRDVDIAVRQQEITETIATLHKLVQEKKLQSYGIKTSVAPYIYHNPPLKGAGEAMTFPISMEEEIMDSDHSCDMVMYPISPSIALPTTYPMLDPDQETYQEPESTEAKRTFTRIAFDALLCKPGLGSMETSSLEEEEKFAAKSQKEEETVVDLISDVLPEKVEEVLAQVLDELCPPLASTPRLQDKGLRVVFSVGVDVVLLDAESSAYVGKLALQPKDMLSSDATEDVFGSFVIPRKPLTDQKG